MAKTPIVTMLVLALLTGPFLAGGVSAETNEEQTGRSVECSFYDATPSVLKGASGDAYRTFSNMYGAATPTQVVTTDGGTEFEVSAENGQTTAITFFDEEGNELGTQIESGLVPGDASWGTVCVVLDDTPWPARKTVADSTTTFHYQDGFPTSS